MKGSSRLYTGTHFTENEILFINGPIIFDAYFLQKMLCLVKESQF